VKTQRSYARRLGALAAVTLVAALVAPLPPTHAAPPRPASLEALLDAIDVVPPDAAALLSAFPDAERRLTAIAQDTRRSGWHRQRALSLLSFLPNERTRATVLALCESSSDRDLAALATYTLGRAFGATLGTRELSLLERRAVGPDEALADYAVRALRWVDHADARRILDRVIAETRSTHPERSRLATTTQSRRNARLSR